MERHWRISFYYSIYWTVSTLRQVPVCLFSLPAAWQLWALPLVQPNLWLQLVLRTPEVRGTLGGFECWRSAILALINMHLVCFRCSDGMDRHRQEWLDYACLDEVLLDIEDEYALIHHFLIPMLLFCFIRAEQRCNLWGLLQGRQLHWLLRHAGDRGRDLLDSSTEKLWKWWWVWGGFFVLVHCTVWCNVCSICP